jgi:YD repeat-containing protein
MSRWIRSLFGRSLAVLQVAMLLSAGCTGGPLAPTPGTAEYLAPGMIRVPGGVVNAAGGNLLVERSDLTLDSVVGGTLPVGAVYNSNLAGWTWSFAVRWNGVSLTDASGRSFDTTGLAHGAAIPGTHWLKVDFDTVQTKGGLAHDFDGLGRLAVVRWATLDYPRIRYTWSTSSLEIAQCTTAAACTGFYAIAFDASQRPVSVTDTRGGRRAEFSWNGLGRLAVAKSPLEVAKGWPGTRYEYGGAGRLTAITNSEGERVEYAYQSGNASRA